MYVGLKAIVGSRSMADSESMLNMTSCHSKSMAGFFKILIYGNFVIS